MKKEKLMEYVGKFVTVRVSGIGIITGKLEYIKCWLDKYDFRCPNLFLCGDITFRAIDVLEIKEEICVLNRLEKY